MLFGLHNTFRSLTMSPVDAALHQVRQQTRQYLESGGTASPTSIKAKPKPAPADDFVLPKDLDADEVAKVIAARLSSRGLQLDARDGSEPLIQRRAGGRVVVPAAHLLRLGDGRFDKGRRFMHSLVWQIRRRRMPRVAHRIVGAAVRT